MKEKLLRLNSRHEPPVDEPARPGRKLEGGETGQRLAGDHDWRTFTLQLDLAQQARDLHGVDGGAFRTRLYHEL